MERLLWCFLSFRGVLGRQAFALSLLLLVLAGWILRELLQALLVGDGPIYYDQTSRAAALKLADMDDALSAIILLWPNLAVPVKRARDVGIPIAWLALAQLALLVALVIAPVLAPFGAILLLLTLCAAPAGSVARFFPPQR